MTVSGTGFFSVSGGLRLTGAPAVGRNSAGRVTQNGGTVTVAGGLNMARTTATNTAARRGEYNLNGGVLNANQITQDAGTDTFGTFNFNGGTLKPTASSATFMQGLTTAQIKTGGAFVNTNGFDITIAQSLLTGGAGDGGLTKSGAGTLILAGANTYTGPTNVTAGRLALRGSLTGAISASSGSTLAPIGLASATGNIAVPAGAIFQVQLNGATAGTQYDRLTAGGSVTLGGTVNVITSANLAPGTTFTILSKTSAGAVSGTFAGLPNNATFAAGGYTFRISYTGGDGNDVVLTLLASQLEQWRYANFGSMLNTGAGADLTDANGDGEVNLVEFATAQNPNATTLTTTGLVNNGAVLEFTYTRSKAAVLDGIAFTVEWSDTLEAGIWSTTGIANQNPPPVAQNAETETLGILVPAGNGGKRFVHLKVTKP